MPISITHFQTNEDGNSLTFAFLENWDKGLPKKDQLHINESYRLEIIRQLSLFSKKNRSFEILSASYNRNKEVLYFTVRLKYHTHLHDMEAPYKLPLAENPQQPKKDSKPKVVITPAEITAPLELPFFTEKSPMEREYWIDTPPFEECKSIASSRFISINMKQRVS